MFGGRDRMLGGRVREYQQKFLATNTACVVALANRGLNGPAYFTQNLIPRLMSKGIVDALEVIDVQYADTQRLGPGRLPLISRNLPFKLLHHRTPVGQAGEWVA